MPKSPSFLQTVVRKWSYQPAVSLAYPDFNAVLLLLLTLAFCGPLAKAQFDNLSFERIRSSQGLPLCEVEKVIEDQYGFLWFATCEGLFRYDGYQFKAFRHDILDSTSLSNPYVRSLVEDNYGNIWVGTDRGLDLLDRRTGKFRNFKLNPNEKESKIGNHIWQMFDDQQGNLVVSSDRGKFSFDKEKGKFIELRERQESPLQHFVRSFFLDQEGSIWAGTNEGLLKFDMQDASFVQMFPDTLANSPFTLQIKHVVVEEDGSFLMATLGGLARWHPGTGRLETRLLPEGHNNIPVDFLLKDCQGNLWIAFRGKGLGIYDTKKQKLHHFAYDPDRYYSLISNQIFYMYEDQFSNVWIATASGVCKVRMDNSGFRLLKNVSGFDHYVNHIERVYRDKQGNIWSKTPQGIFVIKPGGNTSKKIDIRPGLKEYRAGSWFLEDPQGGLWTSVEGKGMYRLSPGTDVFQQEALGDTLAKVIIYKMEQDVADRNIAWIGTSLGFCRFNWITRQRQWFFPKKDIPSAPSNKIAIFEQFGTDEIWLYYTYYNSLGRFDKKTGRFEQYRPEPEQQEVLEGAIKDITISSDGNIWLATLFGLTNFHIPTRTYRIYTKKDGLAENELNTVLLDQKEQLWICGHRILSVFDRQMDRFHNYLVSDEIMRFISKAKFIAGNGQIFLGSLNGIYTFHPNGITKNQIQPRIVLTDFKVKGESYLLDQAFEDTRKIVLSHHENDLTFEFSALHFVKPGANEYRCRLEGFDDVWQSLGLEHRAVYANLDPGNYVFRVAAANSDGMWNEQGMAITLIITPSFWQTRWFVALIILIALSIAYAVVKNRQHQLLLKRQKELAEQSAEYKSRFLADISHEIRTPMNAIIGLSQLVLDTPLNKKQTRFLQAIQKSSNNLLAIINDLLDHSKLDSGRFSFVTRPFSLTEVMGQIQDVFSFQAQEKQLEFLMEMDPAIPAQLNGDAIRLNQILTNLVGNALKFTQEGQIGITARMIRESPQECEVYFEVSDTGVGIPKGKIHSIFEGFVQTESGMINGSKGTGLGLSITRRLVEKQGGRLYIESELEKGTRLWFSLTFEKTKAEARPVVAERLPQVFGHIRILVVEDTFFNQMYLIELLKKYARNPVFDVAENGQIALDLLQQKAYDIILMDVKMPVLDGYETTRIIRRSPQADIRNIPIIGVTASAITEQLQHCLAAGMDDCITKPIETSKLLQKMNTLLNREEKPNLIGLTSLMGGDEQMARKFLSIFKTQTPEQLATLKDYITCQSWEEASICAHAIKNQCRYLGLDRPAQLALKIESYTEQRTHMEELPGLFAELEAKLLGLIKTFA